MSLGPVGMNSGMDINAMVSKIVDSERVPKQQRIDSQRTQNNASISAYGRLRESLDTMKTLMTNFRQKEAFALRKVDTTNESVVSATATTDAIAGRYAIDVLQLAQSHKVASNVFAEDTKFGPGKLHISLGNRSFSVDVQSDSRLKDVVNGINSAKGNPGVRASVINDINGPRLIVAANQSGEENKIQIHSDAPKGSTLKQLEYKTLEQRVKDLEKARSQAQQLITPLTPEQQKIAGKVAEKLETAARAVDQSVADEIRQAAEKAQSDGSTAGELPDTAVSAVADAAKKAQDYVRPEERIPGWSETASGTLLDSYQEPEAELDQSAIDKSGDVPGWSNTASGTLYDSYVTPKEAQAKLRDKLSQEEAEIESAVRSGAMTPEEAKAQERAKLSPEERAYIENIEKVQSELQAAQDAFDAYQGMSEVQAAQDAKVMLDGVATLSSNNNVIENAIDGVDLTVKGKTKSNQPPAEIDIEYDRDTVRDDIHQFVDSYNQFYQLSKELSNVDPQTGEAGPLAGDSVVRNADSRLKRVFSSQIRQAPENLKSLTEFGITTTRQGTLEINEDMLTRQLNNNFDKLGDFFGGRDGFAKRVEDAIQNMTGVTGSLRTRENSMVEQNRRLDGDQESLNRRMDTLEQRTHDKFLAMQDATSKMQSQLSGMMNALGPSNG
ncbi:flagellar filament capping protein FliD [Vibrio mangrovi]|uniref:Flagellar hook-associated protein 2 n=1 Tax=Vibrio mangrovi TaxID=474394 RepID=A0A1Y6IS18_9VIBR|nr:flagellar filament capping protein FliD [Vibrio mangrovi]MDW6001523.1 flagellar filament capping protein FliD [Vibrio mangrovi]SMS00454.1 Flagellar hook-associated protein 2 [Vibrio mangrovi]